MTDLGMIVVYLLVFAVIIQLSIDTAVLFSALAGWSAFVTWLGPAWERAYRHA